MASEAATHANSPHHRGFVGTCSLGKGDFHVRVFTLEFRVSFGRLIFLMPLGATWNSLKNSLHAWVQGHVCNLLYLFVCT